MWEGRRAERIKSETEIVRGADIHIQRQRNSQKGHVWEGNEKSRGTVVKYQLPHCGIERAQDSLV